MSKEQVKEKVIAIIGYDMAGADSVDAYLADMVLDAIKGTTKFREELGGDSLDVVQVVMSIEREFNVSFTDEEVDRHLNKNDAVVQDFIDLTFEKVNG